MRHFPWRDILSLFIAVTIAIGIFFVVKKFILPPIPPRLTKEYVFVLEVFVFLVLMTAFINGEIFNWFEAYKCWMNRENLPNIELTWKHIFLVFSAFIGSLGIYAVFITVLNLP